MSLPPLSPDDPWWLLQPLFDQSTSLVPPFFKLTQETHERASERATGCQPSSHATGAKHLAQARLLSQLVAIESGPPTGRNGGRRAAPTHRDQHLNSAQPSPAQPSPARTVRFCRADHVEEKGKEKRVAVRFSIGEIGNLVDLACCCVADCRLQVVAPAKT